MADMSELPKFTLRLIIDEEKNKVVLAEACRDFVDVLFSLMTLPMGTISGLLKKHQKSEIGCFSNLYNSVADMSIDSFMTGACKQMLLDPRSVKDADCKRLKLNLNPNNDGLKYFKCSFFSNCNKCSDFSGSECACGRLMEHEIELTEEDDTENDVDGVFVSGRSSFIITDDLKVSVDSTGLVLKTLNSLGCSDVSKLGEQLLDIGLSEIMCLLECVFYSNTPLTDALLKKQSPSDMTNIHMLTPSCLKETKTEVSEFTIDAIVRKQDTKILYVECGEDFVDLLFSFLAVPLEYVCDTSLGCTGNLRRSFKDLTDDKRKEEGFGTSKCVLPHYYKCQKQVSVITTEEAPLYYRYRNSNPRQPDYSLTRDCDRTLLYRKDRIVPVTVIDPKSPSHHGRDDNGSGFVKRGRRFTVSDDLIITTRGCLSTSICFIKKYQIKGDDVDVHVIRIREAEVMNLLRASLGTSSALNSALWNLIAKKPKMET